MSNWFQFISQLIDCLNGLLINGFPIIINDHEGEAVNTYCMDIRNLILPSDLPVQLEEVSESRAADFPELGMLAGVSTESAGCLLRPHLCTGRPCCDTHEQVISPPMMSISTKRKTYSYHNDLNEPSDDSEGVKPKRKRASPEQIAKLKEVFKVTPFPPLELRQLLARSLGMSMRSVQIWFQNHRQQKKSSSCNNRNFD